MTDSTPRFDPDAPPERPVELPDGEALDAIVETYPRVLVEFYTDGCGICASMEPILGAVAANTDTVVATINPREDPPLIDDYRITSVPTFVLFVDGEVTDRQADGFVPAADLTDFAEA